MWFVFILSVIAAFADIIGGLFTVFKRFDEREILIVTGLGAGFLLGATLLDRLPDAMAELPTTAPLYIVIGYLALLFTERFGVDVSASESSRWDAHHAGVVGHSHPAPHSAILSQKAATISFVGLLFHTFMDGVIIAGAFSISESTGILIFFAIAMHKIPEGFSMATISLAAGTSRLRALLTSTALALSTIIGAFVTLQLHAVNIGFVKILMALATGTFLFVSTTDMIPAIKDKRISAILSVFVGVIVFYISLLLVKHVGLR